jgi:hypothetical protein
VSKLALGAEIGLADNFGFGAFTQFFPDAPVGAYFYGRPPYKRDSSVHPLILMDAPPLLSRQLPSAIKSSLRALNSSASTYRKISTFGSLWPDWPAKGAIFCNGTDTHPTPCSPGLPCGLFPSSCGVLIVFCPNF